LLSKGEEVIRSNIQTESDYQKALAGIETLMGAKAGTLELKELKQLTIVVEGYEDRHYPINLPDPVESIKTRMDQLGESVKDTFS
jgi:HTH-type transcriptional regulator / antitoxin HigA